MAWKACKAVAKTDFDVDEEDIRLSDDVLERNQDFILGQLANERTVEFLERNPDLTRPSEVRLGDAKSLFQINPSAAVIFAMSSVELTQRDLLLKPIIAGMVHHPSLTEVVSTMVDARHKHIQKLLDYVFEEIGIGAMQAFQLPDGSSVLAERNSLQKVRNAVLHQGGVATMQEAERSIRLAAYFLNELYPKFVDHLTAPQPDWD